jgi:sigma-B regulation protein RsbU (phosphoserine phosphatase)
MSILFKFSMVVIALLVLSSAALAWLGVSAQRSALQAEAIARGRTIARGLAGASAEAMASRDPLTLINLAVDAKSLNRGVVYAALVDRQGRIVGHSERSYLGKVFNLDEVLALPNLGADVNQATVGSDYVWDMSAEVVPKGAHAPVGHVHVGLSQSEVLGSIHRAVVRQVSLVIILVLVGAGLSVFFMSLLVKPLRELAGAARKVGAGDFSVKVRTSSQDEVGQLIEGFNQMTANLETAQRERAEKERMQGELNVAHKIQANLLPTQPPEIKGWTLAFHCVPAKELGGDFYDWFLLEKGRKLGLVIADVSGKGVPAALHMANLRNLMRFAAQANKGPMATLKAVNEHAYPDLNQPRHPGGGDGLGRARSRPAGEGEGSDRHPRQGHAHRGRRAGGF